MSGQTESTVPARMLPELTELNRSYWTDGADGKLHVPYCDRCARWVLPPTADCPDCDGELAPRPVSGDGVVYTFTVNHHPFNPSVPSPYVIALGELVEQPGLLVAANIVDCEPDSVVMGMPVAVGFERQGDTVFVPVFAPRTA